MNYVAISICLLLTILFLDIQNEYKEVITQRQRKNFNINGMQK
jgi:hypothetical protein